MTTPSVHIPKPENRNAENENLSISGQIIRSEQQNATNQPNTSQPSHSDLTVMGWTAPPYTETETQNQTNYGFRPNYENNLPFMPPSHLEREMQPPSYIEATAPKSDPSMWSKQSPYNPNQPPILNQPGPYPVQQYQAQPNYSPQYPNQTHMLVNGQPYDPRTPLPRPGTTEENKECTNEDCCMCMMCCSLILRCCTICLLINN